MHCNDGWETHSTNTKKPRSHEQNFPSDANFVNVSIEKLNPEWKYKKKTNNLCESKSILKPCDTVKIFTINC